jgi:zinc D-Ala-D-Ala carboxypeptidase
MNDNFESDMMQLGIEPAVLVARGLCRYEEACNLEVIQIDASGKEHCLIPSAASAWRDMKNAALIEGVELVVVSAFRSIARQTEIIQRKLEAGLGIKEILSVSAAPGYSEHHTGRAVDITSPGAPVLEETFELTGTFTWLQQNAPDFGFYLSYSKDNNVGYQYEPWHWCYKTPNMLLDSAASHRST